MSELNQSDVAALTEATQKLEHLFCPGYGGYGLRFVELVDSGKLDRMIELLDEQSKVRRAAPGPRKRRSDFRANPHTTVDKEVVIFDHSGACSLGIIVDFDDVNHDQVEQDIQKLLQILNQHWA